MVRDHLFISYAWEDAPLAEWLTLKLTADGYKVWCDRFKLLGGDRWPDDIDEAIKCRTFRLIHLLSASSLHKDNPSKERQLALTLSKERKENFLIPLNVDGLPASEIPWQLTDIQYIAFQNWASGFDSLRKALQSANTPRPLLETGATIAIDASLPPEFTRTGPETVYSNCLKVTSLPSVLRRFRFSRTLSDDELSQLKNQWAFVKVDGFHVLSFTAPPLTTFAGLSIIGAGGTVWNQSSKIDGKPTRHIISGLLKSSLINFCTQKGLSYLADDDALAFEAGKLERNRIRYTSYKGRRTRLSVVGERKIGIRRFSFRLGFKVKPITLGDEWLIQIRLRPKIVGDHELTPRQIIQRRKRIVKSWWNHQWLSAHLAVASFLSDGSQSIVIGAEEGKITISGTLETFQASVTIVEEGLREIRSEIEATVAAVDDLDEEGDIGDE